MSDLNETLRQIQLKMAQELLHRIESGEATAQEMNVARQLLNDNHIVAATTLANPHIMRLADVLPFPTEEAKAG